jgi:hypothetical protein
MAKVVDNPGIPGGDPDRPGKFGVKPACTTKGCERRGIREGLCVPCHDDHLVEMGKEPTEDQWNEAFDKAKNT